MNINVKIWEENWKFQKEITYRKRWRVKTMKKKVVVGRFKNKCKLEIFANSLKNSEIRNKLDIIFWKLILKKKSKIYVSMFMSLRKILINWFLIENFKCTTVFIKTFQYYQGNKYWSDHWSNSILHFSKKEKAF